MGVTRPHSAPGPVVHLLPTNDRLNVLAGHLNAIHAAIVELVASALADDSWGGDGVRSPQQWLCWQLGITTAEAQRLLALAAARDTHPAVSGQFAAGQLSLTQAAIATTVDATRDQEVAELVTACTITQLKLFTKAMKTSDDAARNHTADTDAGTDTGSTSESESDVGDRRSTVDFWYDDDGRFVGRFDLTVEAGRTVESALRHSRDLLFHERNEAVDTTVDGTATGRRVNWADALVEIARRSLDTDESPARRERFRINLFFDPATKPHAEWSDHTAVPHCLLDKLTCDGTLTPTFVADAKPVSVGRTLRIVPDRTRRLVLHRDRHQCRIPWCQRTRWLEVHHLKHWAAGGDTDTPNLIAVCDTCHDAIHRRALHIRGDADDPFGLAFTDHRHQPINYHTPTPSPPTEPPPTPIRPYNHPLGERLDHTNAWINPSKAS